MFNNHRTGVLSTPYCYSEILLYLIQIHQCWNKTRMCRVHRNTDFMSRSCFKYRKKIIDEHTILLNNYWLLYDKTLMMTKIICFASYRIGVIVEYKYLVELYHIFLMYCLLFNFRDSIVPWNASVKYLGVILDKQIKWWPHLPDKHKRGYQSSGIHFSITLS